MANAYKEPDAHEQWYIVQGMHLDIEEMKRVQGHLEEERCALYRRDQVYARPVVRSLLHVRNGRDSVAELRLLYDTGVQATLLTDRAFRRLYFLRQANMVNVTWVGSTTVMTMDRIELEMWHHTNAQVLSKGTFTIIDEMLTILPGGSFAPLTFPHINDDELVQCQ